MTNDQEIHIFHEQIQKLGHLLENFKQAGTFDRKAQYLDALPPVQAFLPLMNDLVKKFALNEFDIFLLKSVAAIGQAPTIFGPSVKAIDLNPHLFSEFLNMLHELEGSYSTIGGIVGYHLTVLKLLVSKKSCCENMADDVSYEEPEGIDLSSDVVGARKAVRWGIENLDKIGEIYPIGGAGDRLNLKDEDTGELLPAAQLLFCGRTLLEGMVRDVQAREYLYYRLFNKQLIVPLALMTSHEKNNHGKVIAICEQGEWFGRPKESFHFFLQPLVPVVTIDGQWAMQEILKPFLKPGGHGMMWKAAIDADVFDWFESHGCYQVMVRQINNPVAGIDNGLLALLGIGCKQKKSFGFASCARVLNTAEGMNVLKIKKVKVGELFIFEHGITNIEYVDFACKGVKDIPVSPGSPFSRFPSNTNILFADLEAVRKAVAICPIPGMLINMKSKFLCRRGNCKEEISAGRLESLMQNIADHIVDRFPKSLKKGEGVRLHTFLTYNERRKTLSVTKETYKEGKSILGTPEGCFYEMMLNYRDLLGSFCGMELPPLESEQEYLENGPAFLALFHPALGPLYEVIAKKIRRGRLSQGAELILEVAEVDVEDLDLKGSLLVEADAIMGRKNEFGLIHYDESACGKCYLNHVTVRNKGINRSGKNVFWKMAIDRSECVRILLHGNGEFFAENVVLEGDHFFEVPDGYRLEVFQIDGELQSCLKKIKGASWGWRYAFGDEGAVILSKKLSSDHDDTEGCGCC